MPQRISKRLDLRTVSPTVRRTENMRLVPPRNIVGQPGIFVDPYTDYMEPVSHNAILGDGMAMRTWPPVALARESRTAPQIAFQITPPIAPMPVDHSALAHARNTPDAIQTRIDHLRPVAELEQELQNIRR